FLFHTPATTEIYTLSLHDALPIYEWDGRIYVELFLPFGLRTAPIIFNLFSEAIHWIMQLKGYDLCHYIDDFLLILPPEPEKVQVDRKSTRLNSSHLGISYAVFCLK